MTSGLLWASPAVLWGMAALAIPIVIHLRLRPDLRRVAFPSLRFIPAGRLASVRRRVLRDWPLLLVRMAAIALVVAALAGPIVVTPARQTEWASRVVRAVVVDAPDGGTGATSDLTGVVEREMEGAVFATRIDAPVGDGLVAAAAWLRQAPPAAREVVVVGAMARDGVTGDMLRVLPDGTGVRLVSVAGAVPAPSVLRRLTVAEGAVWLERRDVQIDDHTSAVSPASSREPAALPLGVEADDAERRLIDAAVSAVLEEGVFVGGPLLPVRLLWGREAPAVRSPVRADVRAAIDRMTQVPAPAPARASAALDDGWVAVWPGRLHAAGDEAGLLVHGTGALDAHDALRVARALVAAMVPAPDLARFERVALSDSERAALERPAAPPDTAAVARAGDTDARWAWALVLVLLGLEQWMRRSQPGARDASVQHEEARVA